MIIISHRERAGISREISSSVLSARGGGVGLLLRCALRARKLWSFALRGANQNRAPFLFLAPSRFRFYLPLSLAPVIESLTRRWCARPLSTPDGLWEADPAVGPRHGDFPSGQPRAGADTHTDTRIRIYAYGYTGSSPGCGCVTVLRWRLQSPTRFSTAATHPRHPRHRRFSGRRGWGCVGAGAGARPARAGDGGGRQGGAAAGGGRGEAQPQVSGERGSEGGW